MVFIDAHRTKTKLNYTEHEYAFCYIFKFICTWAFGSGYISTKIKFCTSLQCCSFCHMLVKLIVFVTLTGMEKVLHVDFCM